MSLSKGYLTGNNYETMHDVANMLLFTHFAIKCIIYCCLKIVNIAMKGQIICVVIENEITEQAVFFTKNLLDLK